jgi:hypothetical protein
MNKILTLASFSIVFSHSYAQNVFPTTGNVGIGTTSPTTNLELKSNINGWLFNIKGVAVNPEEGY